MVRAGEVCAEALVEAALKRIDTVNPMINAVVQVARENARERAFEADQARSRGEIWGPLHGIPMTVKDSLDTAGMISTSGTAGRKNFIPERDAAAVHRLRRAGAILLGKTNTAELTLSYQTNNVIYGRTSNPHDPARTSGGSSGGSAAIVATGAVPFDIGSDTGGSLRIPAHYCGVVALKPTQGRVPRTGHIISFKGHLEGLTTLGPIARFVDDLALLLSIIAGPDWEDPTIAPVPIGAAGDVNLDTLRIAMHIDNGIASPTAQTVETVRNAANVLRSRVARTEELGLPRAADAPRLFADLYGADGGAWRRRLLLAAGTIGRRAAERGANRGLPPAEFSALLEDWDRFRSETLAVFERFDAILCPVTAEPAPPHGEGHTSAFSYTQYFSLTGWPCAVVRGGWEGHLPIGVQIVARPWHEDVALRLAVELEARLGAWTMPRS